MFSHPKKKVRSLELWEDDFFFPHCPFQHLWGFIPYLPWDPFDLAKGGSRDETSKVPTNLED